MKKIIVVGGGAAGMMAAITAGTCSNNVILLEKNRILGKKLSITGKGKCNLTNTEPKISTFIEKFGENGKFLINCFHNFFNRDLIQFFEKNHLQLKEFSGGRIYPASLQATDVIKTLLEILKRSEVTLEREVRLEHLIQSNHTVNGVLTDKEKYAGDAVILATGGKSYPKTGSTGDGYRIAKQAGHQITALRPSLVPLKIRHLPKNLNGLKLKNVEVSILEDGKKLASTFGEFSFRRSTVEGAAIFELSRELKQHLNKNNLKIAIDLKPALTEKKLHDRIIREIRNNARIEYKTLLAKLLPKKMIPVFINKNIYPARKNMAQFNKQNRTDLVNSLKNLTFTITGTESIEKALVTSGGIELNEVDPRSMQSKLLQGLFFAGELLDIDAATGGYNLQAAFSTGYLAGKSAAEYLK